MWSFTLTKSEIKTLYSIHAISVPEYRDQITDKLKKHEYTFVHKKHEIYLNAKPNVVHS